MPHETLRSLFPDPRSSRGDIRSSGGIISALNEWIDSRYFQLTKETRTQIKSITINQVGPSLAWAPSAAEAVLYIARNLIQNSVKNRNYDTARIYLDLIPRPGGDLCKLFYGNRRAHLSLTDAQVDQLCISPIRDGLGRLRFGMFIVGMLARLLGGTAHARYERRIARFTVEVFVPIKGKDE